VVWPGVGVAAQLLPGVRGNLLILVAAVCIEDGGHWLGAGYWGEGGRLWPGGVKGDFNAKTFARGFRKRDLLGWRERRTGGGRSV